ncbi:MAG: hypothetical protein E6J42_09390 [Chloroflexi bacterium]|nr:MAG: hypothetical protein E6J42_09390 [Chloroflexota bacterium]
MSAQAMRRTFVDRMIGAARLNSSVYEEVEADSSAMVQAIAVVAMAAVAAGIGAILEGPTAVLVAIVIGIVGWAAYAFVAYWVGVNWFKGPQTSATWGELLRTLGFANTPRLLLIFAFIPILGWFVYVAVFIWMLFTTVIAIRQALDFGTGEAIGTAVVSWLVFFVISFALRLIFEI